LIIQSAAGACAGSEGSAMIAVPYPLSAAQNAATTHQMKLRDMIFTLK